MNYVTNNEVGSEVTTLRKRPIMRNRYLGSRRNVAQPPLQKNESGKIFRESPKLSKDTEIMNGIKIWKRVMQASIPTFHRVVSNAERSHFS